MKWQQLFDRLPFRLVEGDGFSIKLFAHSGFVRYTEGRRDLTLVSKIVSEAGGGKRRFFQFFRGRSRIMYVPSKLTWDDGTALEQSECGPILARICETIQGRKGRCSVTIDDGLYAEMQRDAETSATTFRIPK
jgi:hypothetical protein